MVPCEAPSRRSRSGPQGAELLAQRLGQGADRDQPDRLDRRQRRRPGGQRQVRVEDGVGDVAGGVGDAEAGGQDRPSK